MDEPLGTLDAEFRDLMVHELRELHNRIQRDHGLRHARPARSDVDGRQDRGDEPRRHRAVRHAAGDLRPAGVDVRRRFHRLAADELPAASTAASQRARSAIVVQGAHGRRAGSCARTSRRPSWRSASGPSTSASTTLRSCAARSTAPNISARRRSSRSRRRDGMIKARVPAERQRAHRASTVGLALQRASGCRCSTRRPAARSAPRCTTEARHG